MRVTTGGVSVGVGALIVGTLGIAGVLTVRDENDGRDDCQPQSFEVAKAATQAFMEEYLHSDSEDSSARGAIVMPSDQARDHVDKATTVPEWTGSGYIIIVDYDPATDEPSPPSCFDETPVLYVNPKRVTG